MCVWRRKPLQLSNNGETLPIPSLNADVRKELWVFWFTETAPDLKQLCAELEEDQEIGSEANSSNSVSYEVRVLFFKAIHVLLERQLMEIGYVRFGRWFAKPQRGKKKEMHHTHSTSTIAMNFHYFVHGGNTICCAVKTQRQPTLIKLQKRHLEYDSMKRRITVLVGPWSLRGYLVRNQLQLLAEPRWASKAEKQLAEWRDFVQCDFEEPREDDENEESIGTEPDGDVPKMVLVEIDGIRMLFPSRFVCLTLEDDRLVWDALGIKVTTVPEELVVMGPIPRNKFVTTAVNAYMAIKGGFESALYERIQRNPIQPIITSGGFAHPFPPVNEHSTKWRFYDESRMECAHGSQACTICSFLDKRQQNGGPMLMDRTEFTAVRTDVKSKRLLKPDKRAYHRVKNPMTAKVIMIKEKQQQDAAPLPPEESHHDSLWQQNHHVFHDTPDWAKTDGDEIPTGIYVNTEGSSNQQAFNSNTNSSDDESVTWTPFTPIRALSPCNDCEWPALPADQMPEATFNSIFQPNKTVRLPATASQEDKSKEYDNYYNPTLASLRVVPEYATYHNKRRGEKRKSTYPPNLRLPGDEELTSSSRMDNPLGSVEEPGSQETIPAKASPDGVDGGPEEEDGDVKIVQVEEKKDKERAKLLDYLNIKDEPMKRRRKKKQKKCVSVPDIRLLEMAIDNEPLKEEMGPKLEIYAGMVSPVYQRSPEYRPLSDEVGCSHPGYAEDVEEKRALGEGTSMKCEDGEPMETDQEVEERPPITAPGPPTEVYGQDSILSPPASNEMARGGPPSVGDTMFPKGPPSVEASMAAAMNQIYPTPPSVQFEMQQYSPATTTIGGTVPMVQTPLALEPPPSALMATSTDTNIDERMDGTGTASTSEGIEIVPNQGDGPTVEEMDTCVRDNEQYEDEEEDENIEQLKDRVKNKEIIELMAKINVGPLKSAHRKILLPPSDRFNGVSQALQDGITTRRLISVPPKYPKMIEPPSVPLPKKVIRPPIGRFATTTRLERPPWQPGSFPGAQMHPQQQQQHQMQFGQQGPSYQSLQQQQFHHQQHQHQHQQQQMMFNPSMGPGGYPGGPQHPLGPFPGPMGAPGMMGRQPGTFGPGMQMGMPPSQQQQQQMYGQQMRNPMMNPAAMGRGQMPPPYGAPSAGGPGFYGNQYTGGNFPPQTSVQQLNNFVNQPRFGTPNQGGPFGPMGGPQNPMMPGQFGANPFGGMDQQSQFNAMRQAQFGQPPMGMAGQQRMGMGMQMPQQLGRTPSTQAMVPMSQTANSVIPKEPQMPEGESVVLAIILSDTILDLHYDSFLDSCPICSCNVSIRARELGLYITPPNSLRAGAYLTSREPDVGPWSGFYVNGMQSPCTCGFSAIRHRYLSFGAGLFPEDSGEATALENSVANVVTVVDGGHQATELSKSAVWFDSASAADLALVDQIRQLSQVHSYGKAMAHMATLFEMADKVAKASGVSMDVSTSSEYVISQIDSMELQRVGNSAIDMSLRGLSANRSTAMSSNKFLTYFHPWGLQMANEMRDPITPEAKYALEVVSPALENAIRIARAVVQPTGGTGGNSIIEGPLTWKQFVLKCQKSRNNAEQQEDDSYQAEPIPCIITATERESIRSAPGLRQIGEATTLAPIDQPKDILYLAIVPDSDVAVEKMAKFMEQLSAFYERQRLGRHVAFPTHLHPEAARLHEPYVLERQQQREHHLAQIQQQQLDPIMTDPLLGGGMISNPSTSLIGGPATSEPMEVDQPQPQPQIMDIIGDEATNPMIEGDDGRPITPPESIQYATNPSGRPVMDAWPPHFEIPYKMPESLEDMKRIPTSKFPFGEPCRDAILRVGGKARMNSKFATPNAANSLEFANMTKTVNDSHGFVTRLKLFTQQLEDQVMSLLMETPKVFDRSTFRVQLAQRMKYKKCKQAAHVNYIKERRTDQDDSRDCGSATPPLTQGNSSSPSQDAGPDSESSPPTRCTSQPTLHDLLAEPSSSSAQNQQQQQQTPIEPLRPEPLEPEDIPFDEPGTLPHVIVLYVTNPFTWGRENHSPLLMRVSIIAIIRTFNSILSKIPMKLRPQLQLEIIGMDQLEDFSLNVPDYLNDSRIPLDLCSKKGNTNYYDALSRDAPTQVNPELSPVDEVIRALSTAVYTHPRVLNPDCYKTIQPRCMTSFGPGSQLLKAVDEMERMNCDLGGMGMREKKGYFGFKIPCNIIHLAPPPIIYQKSENGKVVVSPGAEETALYVTYCLAGADFLLATVTDGQGKLMDNCVINMKCRVDANHTFKYKQRTQILDAMGRLWTFILGVMASDVKNWRLVVGRLGRIGHGEYRAWAHLLNKNSLQKYSSRLKDICMACSQMPGAAGTPAILSACLVTTEPEPNVRFFFDYVEKETNSKKSKQVVAPEDVSCTHIVTFPVGAEINYDTQDASADDTKNEENWDFGDLDLGNDFEDGMKDIIKDVTETTIPQSSSGRAGMFSYFNDDANVDYQNQPLASGFYFSTAPAPDLPDWFWASCPSRKRSIPVHLKSSLHINVPEIKNDDIMESAAPTKEKEKGDQREPHPLESHQTEEVLRHVLETYNALSWLNTDPVSGKRFSCLPIHMQHLLRLYHSVVRLLM